MLCCDLPFERKLEIIAEALSQLAQLDALLAAEIPDLREIVAFRNILVHAYAYIDYARVWRVIEADLPKLQRTLKALLGSKHEKPSRARRKSATRRKR